MKALYARSVAAAKRYMRAKPQHGNEISQAMYTAKFEMYRAGWMIGYRAGLRMGRKKSY